MGSDEEAAMTETMTIEQRLDRLEQIEAIKDLKHRYFRACDAKDPDTFRACFIAHGADVDFGPVGSFKDADHIATVFRQIALHTVDGVPTVLDMHHGLHPQITILGDGYAHGAWTLKFRQLNLIERTERVLTGEYDDEYRFEDGRWRIARSHFHELWSIIRPLPDDAIITS